MSNTVKIILLALLLTGCTTGGANSCTSYSESSGAMVTECKGTLWQNKR